MKRLLQLLVLAVMLLPTAIFAQKHYDYITYSHDAMNTRIYKLDNGLQVYLTVYKDAPRIQCLIPVRAGSKNDPAETTGLAHYLEHLMFKGTTHFGTTNWEAEKPILDDISLYFENYRYLRDPERRAQMYHIIDSLSYLASGYAIPNEYDKMMKFIGSQGTNAGTSNDYTVYIEDIPSNQLENWAAIQLDRFQNPVFRIFHTELETVYEEKNTSLANDGRKESEAMLNALFPNHPYGQQTTLGSVEHLKNPSILNIEEFFKKYYVPNNMAICLAGDFDFDEAIAIIDKYFGKLKPRKVPTLHYKGEDPITSPIYREVVGHESEDVVVAFRMDLPANSQDIYILQMLNKILYNGKCGLLDRNLNQTHAVNESYSYPYVLCDNSAFVLSGEPNEGQSLEEVATLLLKQVQLLKSGDFDESLIQSALNNFKAREIQQLQSNRSRANALAKAYENNIDWYYASQTMNFYEKITKQDIIDFANKHFGDSSFVVVYKRQGIPPEVEKVTKPAITAIQVNREAESDFFKNIKAREVKPIEPVFVDFQQAITFDNYKGIPVDYLHNEEDETFTLKWIFPAGEMNDITLPYATQYLKKVGTSKMTLEDIQSKFYALACNFSVSCSDDETHMTLSGLSENMVPALRLMMEIVNDAQPDAAVLKNLIDDVLLQRKKAKTSQNSVMNCLRSYCEYGPELVKYQLNSEQLQQLTGEQLLKSAQQLLQYKPEILYYGPLSVKKVKKAIAANYKLPKTFTVPPAAKKINRKTTSEDVVFYAPYPAKQSRLITSMCDAKPLDVKLMPTISMYNQYFGGSMNAIVFQEMREKRSLAYSAKSAFVIPSDSADYMYNYSYIATQNDKIVDAMTAFDSLFNNMPLSESAFNLAKDGAKASIAANRITKMSILNTYIKNRKMGITYDYRKDFYQQIDNFTLQDLQAFNAKYIQNKPKTYMILAKDGEVDFDIIGKNFGPVTRLTLEDIFGY